MSKTPRTEFASQSKKEPRTGVSGATDFFPAWRFGRIDFGGPWCPTCMTKEIVVEITKKLGQLEGQNWEQIKQNGSHYIPTSRIIKEAQKRLAELKLDDADDLFSLRFSGRERLWGIRNGNLFHALWWDPEHKICPSALKHT